MSDIDECELRKSLEHGTRKERCDAAAAAGDAGGDVHPLVLSALARAVWEDESRAVRRAAAESLYRLGDAGFDMLMRMLIDDSIKMRLMAEQFSRMGDTYYYHFYELEERDERTRKSIIEALGNFKDKRAVRAMIDMLEKEDAVGKEKTQEEWSSDYNLHWSYVSEHLGKIADADIDTLLDALENGCDVVRICVADALGGVGTGDEKRIMAQWYLHGIETTRREDVDERVVPALIEMLELEVETDRVSRTISQIISRNAAKSLGKLRDERAVPILIKCLDREWGVRNEAARALGKIGDKSAVPGLIKALPLGDAAYALGMIRDESAIPVLKEELEYEIEDVEEHGYCDSYWKSARALCEFGDAGLAVIVDVIRPHMKAQKSFDKLVEIVKKERTDDEDYGYNEDPLALELYDLYYKLQKEPVIIPVLLYLMKHGSSDVRCVAAQMMCLLDDKNIHHLVDLLQDGDVRVREAAAWLGYEYPEYLEETTDLYFEVDSWYDETDQLLEVLKDSTLSVYNNIFGLFGKLTFKDPVDIGYVIGDLAYLIEDPDSYVRETVTKALYHFGLNVYAKPSDQDIMCIIKTLLDMSEDENVHEALRWADECCSWQDWYNYHKPEIVTHAVIETLIKNKNVALSGGMHEDIVAIALTELPSETWGTIIQALYDKNLRAIRVFDDFSSNVLPDCATIETLIETLNDCEAEEIDRKISAMVLKRIHRSYSRKIDEIGRNSDRILSALSELAGDVDVVDIRQLDELFREYHESKEEELDEQH